MPAPRLGTRTAWLLALVVTAAVLSFAEAKRPPADQYGDPLPAGALARLGTTRWRHGADITFVAFGPEGKTLVTAGQDHTVRLWDLATGRELRRFAPPQAARTEGRPVRTPLKVEPPSATDAATKKQLEQAATLVRAAAPPARAGILAALTSDGKTLAVTTGSAIQLYEVETGKELPRIMAPTNSSSGLLFSPDGQLLAARGSDGTVTLWKTETGKEVYELKAPPAPEDRRLQLQLARRGGDAPGMAFTPDGAALAVATTEYRGQSANSFVAIWDVTTGKESRRIEGANDIPVSGVAVSPDGKLLAYGAASSIHLCDADTGKEVRIVRAPEGVATLTFSPDSTALAVRSRGQQIHLWDATTGKERYRLGEAASSGPRTGVIIANALAPESRILAFSPDGRRLVSGVGSAIRLWDAATGREVPLGDGHQGALAAVAISADGRTFVSWGADRTLRRWDAATGKLIASFPAPGGTTLGCVAPDGQLAALANADNTIHLIETATGKERHKLIGSSRGTAALAFSPDGKLLATRDGNDGITLYDVKDGGELRTLTPAAAPLNGLVIVDTTGRPPGSARAGLAFSPDGKLLASPGGSSNPRSTSRAVHLLDIATGKIVRTLEPPQAVTSLAFSPDGRILAAENADQTITLWDVASGHVRSRLGKTSGKNSEAGPVALVAAKVGGPTRAESAGPVTLAFAANGRALVARGLDRAVHVWDVDTAAAVSQHPGHEGRVETLAVSPDGRRVLSGSADTTLLAWDAAALLKQLPRPERAELSDDDVHRLWNDLTFSESDRAFESLLKLSRGPERAVPFLAERLEPAAAVNPRQLERWLANLESEKYPTRREAAAQLVNTGEQAVPPLQKLLASQPTIETRKRAEEILDKLTGGTLNAEQLRLVRAVEALERMDTAEARQLLRTLADGAPGALATNQAQAALARLTR